MLIVGLGNIPLPYTRHRWLWGMTMLWKEFELTHIDRISIGHVIVDSLADRLGASWSTADKHKGLIASAAAELDDSLFNITLFKPCKSSYTVKGYVFNCWSAPASAFQFRWWICAVLPLLHSCGKQEINQLLLWSFMTLSITRKELSMLNSAVALKDIEEYGALSPLSKRIQISTDFG